ncbi:MAG: 50S ribosomal protein L24 [Candidatus Tectomicrobia bacterium]|nr:50S ribosomal protein L24 [Candidatus Tectomicrobia bacterium]
MARGKTVSHISRDIKKDDFVRIIAGRDRGKQGKVLQVYPKDERLRVERIHMIKRHTRATQQMQGGIIEREGTIHISNVMLLCAKCGRGVRVGHQVLDDGKKVRVCRRCGDVLDK